MALLEKSSTSKECLSLSLSLSQSLSVCLSVFLPPPLSLSLSLSACVRTRVSARCDEALAQKITIREYKLRLTHRGTESRGAIFHAERFVMSHQPPRVELEYQVLLPKDDFYITISLTNNPSIHPSIHPSN